MIELIFGIIFFMILWFITLVSFTYIITRGNYKNYRIRAFILFTLYAGLIPLYIILASKYLELNYYIIVITLSYITGLAITMLAAQFYTKRERRVK